jgi:hypothetical protein
MGLIRLGLLGAAGYGLYKYMTGRSGEHNAAFAHGETAPGNDTQVRNAGADAMRDSPRRWSKTDETSDASFPASDPPSTY